MDHIHSLKTHGIFVKYRTSTNPKNLHHIVHDPKANVTELENYTLKVIKSKKNTK